MATIRDPKTKPIVTLADKLRGSLLRFRDTRITADGIELEAIDESTGQRALITVSPINAGACPLCGHVSHDNAQRCEAVVAFTKKPCGCRPFYGQFPVENRTQEELDGKVAPAWTRR